MVGGQSKSVAMRPNNPQDRDLLGDTQNRGYYTAEMTFCKTAIRPSNYIVMLLRLEMKTLGRLETQSIFSLVVTTVLLLSLIAACTYEENTKVSIDGENPPTFKLYGSGHQQHFVVSEVSPDNYVHPSRQNPEKDLVLWKIVPVTEPPPRAWDYPAIKYGGIPSKFTQELPKDGVPPPLVEGRLYEAGGPAYGANGGSVLFTIRDGKSVIVPEPPK